jgi:hypothetical protein
MIHRARANSFVKGRPLVPSGCAGHPREYSAGYEMIRSRRKSENHFLGVHRVVESETAEKVFRKEARSTQLDSSEPT